MSVMPEQQIVAAPEPVLVEQESLVFAAASIVKELNLGTAGVPVREIVSEDRKYRLEGHRLQTLTDATGPIVLVFVQPLMTALPHDDVLRSRFGLTRKEACVARLIAEDQTNEQIAAELSISPHTARHHTERVLAKLGVRSRTKVRTTLESERVPTF
jgi:DNA-binding CsgD family transcriptional regulator